MGTTYYFIVTAVNSAGESAASNEVSVMPTGTALAPTGLVATLGDKQATLSWTAPLFGTVTSYNVYYGTTPGVTAANGTKVANATSGSAIPSLTNGTTYYFVVTAIQNFAESAVSNEVSSTPRSPSPTVTGSIAAGTGGQATVSWTAITGATSYNVYYGTASGVTAANGTKVTNATSGSTITGLTPNATYYFVVTAVIGGVESATSLEAAAFVPFRLPKFAYVTNINSYDVSVYTIDPATGALTSAGTAVPAMSAPGSVTVDPTGRFAYVAGSSDISVYTINPTTGALTAGTSVAVGTGTLPKSIAIDPSGQHAYVANKGTGTVSVYSINQTTGALTAVGSPVTAGTSPQSVTVDPFGKFVYVANEGASANTVSGTISVYTRDSTTGALTAGTDVAAMGRSLSSVVVDPLGKFAYVTNRLDGTVTVFAINQTTGALTGGTTAARSGSFAMATSINIHPSGRFAYAVDPSNNVIPYTVDQTTGALTEGIVVATAANANPASLAIDASGKFVYVANYSTNDVSVYTINQTTGALTVTSTVSAGTNPTSVTTY